jgi:hypothetical protein
MELPFFVFIPKPRYFLPNTMSVLSGAEGSKRYVPVWYKKKGVWYKLYPWGKGSFTFVVCGTIHRM